MAGPGRILRPTSGLNAPRNVNDSGRRNQPFRYVRPMGIGEQWRTHQKITDAGVSVWIGDHGPYIPNNEAIKTSDGNSYVYINKPASTVDSMTLRKINATTGAVIWSQNYPSNVLGVAPSGNVLIGSNTVTAETRKRIAPSGTALWDIAVTGTRNPYIDAVFNAADEFYTFWNNTGSDITVSHIDASGTVLASNATGTAWGPGTSISYTPGMIATSHTRGANKKTVRAADPANIGVSSAVLWTADHGVDVYGVAISPNGNVITGGDRTLGNLTTRCYNSSGVLQWSADHGGRVNCVAVDASNNIYTGGDVVSGVTTRKYDSSGTLIWTQNYGASVFGICVDNAGGVYQSGRRVRR